LTVLPTLAVSIAVFRDDGRVLLARRTRPPADGMWSLPGGRLEPGETLEQGALRELMEEVGVSAQVLGFNRHVEAIGRRGDGTLTHHFVVCSFVGRWLSGEPQIGPEASEVGWFAPDDLRGLPVTHQLKDVLAGAAAIWSARP
jgi:ADP-ribose pyrophosphatase YjhB (NUDIX family)